MNIDAASKIMFLASVSSLLSMMTSPKQPQSDTGLAIAMYVVRIVIAAIKTVATLAVPRLLMPNSKCVPMVNSTKARMTAHASRNVCGRVNHAIALR